MDELTRPLSGAGPTGTRRLWPPGRCQGGCRAEGPGLPGACAVCAEMEQGSRITGAHGVTITLHVLDAVITLCSG